MGGNQAVVKREVRLDSWQGISHRHSHALKKTRKQAIIQKTTNSKHEARRSGWAARNTQSYGPPYVKKASE